MNMKLISLVGLLIIGSGGIYASQSSDSDDDSSLDDSSFESAESVKSKKKKKSKADETWTDTLSSYWGSTKKAIKKHPKTAALGAFGLATIAFLAYKSYTAKPAPRLEVAPPNISGMPLFADEPSDYTVEKVVDNQVAIPHWIAATAEIANKVYSDLPKAQRDPIIKPLVKMAKLDPHNLLGEKDFMTRVAKQGQLLPLSGVLGEFFIDYVEKVVQELLGDLEEDQDGIEEMFKAIPHGRVDEVLNFLSALVADGHLKEHQDTFVSERLEQLSMWTAIQAQFRDNYNLEELAAKDPRFRRGFEEANRQASAGRAQSSVRR